MHVKAFRFNPKSTCSWRRFLLMPSQSQPNFSLPSVKHAACSLALYLPAQTRLLYHIWLVLLLYTVNDNNISMNDMCLSEQTFPWSVGYAWPVKHVVGWEPDDLNDLAHFCWIIYVVHCFARPAGSRRKRLDLRFVLSPSGRSGLYSEPATPTRPYGELYVKDFQGVTYSTGRMMQHHLTSMKRFRYGFSKQGAFLLFYAYGITHVLTALLFMERLTFLEGKLRAVPEQHVKLGFISLF